MLHPHPPPPPPPPRQRNKSFVNQLFTGDSLHILNGLNSASVDLICLDPPCNSERLHSAPIDPKAARASFEDIWRKRNRSKSDSHAFRAE